MPTIVTIQSPQRVDPVPYSAAPGIAWPAIPAARAARELALQFQLDQSQWWSPAELERAQLGQIGRLLAHAFEHSTFWHERLLAAGYRRGAPVTPGWFEQIPVLAREDVRGRFDDLCCRHVPPDHGEVQEGGTTGSTGMPVQIRDTALNHLLWRAMTLRDALWHGRDLSARFAAVRSKASRSTQPSWGPPFDTLYPTGPLATIGLGEDADTVFAWLNTEDPAYLLAYSNIVRTLALRSIETGRRPRSLRAVCTLGEVLPDDLRALVREAWGVPLTDVYSANEVGYMALQCPCCEHYHVQSENVRLEVVDDAGRPCPPGVAGRVVVTALHNFAFPLVRYRIGDYAVPGEPCACGRGLPVLTRIRGRTRNMLRLPGGSSIWPTIRSDLWSTVPAIRQFQLRQRSLERVDVEVVTDRPLTPDEEREIVSGLEARVGHGLGFDVRRVEAIARGPGLKYEDVVCEVPD